MTTAPAAAAASPFEALIGLVGQAQGMAALRAAVDLGIFDLISEGHRSVAAVAAEAKTDERGTDVLLDALVALGFVEVDDGYRLSPLAEAVLVKGRPGYMGAMVAVMGRLTDLVAPHLADAVRRGGTVVEGGPESPGAAVWEEFASASIGMVKMMAEGLAQALAPFAASRDRLDVLDIACGSGLWSLTLARHQPHAKVTLNDWANVLDVTRPTVATLGLEGRTAYRPGSVFDVDLGGPYDLVVASNIFHMWSDARCRDLLSRLAETLAPGGRIAISGPIPAGPPSENRFTALMSLVIFGLTEGGRCHPLAAYEAMFADTGLELIETVGLPGFEGARTLIAQRA